MNLQLKRKLIIVFFIAVFLLFLWQIYVPKSFGSSPTVVYTAQRGMGDEDIAIDLERQGIIKNNWFFRLYVVILGNHSKLQAGSYNLSSSMSVARIVKKFVSGDVVKNTITIVEGWNLQDIGEYLESRKLYTKAEFLAAAKNSDTGFEFLKDKPKNLSLEGYLFPDTYQVGEGQIQENLVLNMLSNFDKKLTPDLRQEIKKQNKSIFEIITMASILEKEVQSVEDKKIVSGILWKRIENDMGMNVDSTINYITGKNDLRVSIKDTKINSPYNTYKYRGLPLGPICNPGMDSILAAIYPEKSNYWYYLSADGTGKTIFSKTLEEHNLAVTKYLK